MRPQDAKLLRSSSRAAIEQSAARLAPELEQERWLGDQNPYLRVYPAWTWQPAQRDAADDLANYMAATVPVHCVDGWSYLGRAMQAQLRGDVGTATHLGYYAELRAAMALLASEGIGVFNTTQVVVNDHNEAVALSRRRRPWTTHKAVWEILSDWGRRSASAQLISETIQYEGSTLGEWLRSLSMAAALEEVGRELLLQWGLDLSRLAKDRDARNVASYQPSLDGGEFASSRDSVDFLCDAWRMLEPETSSPFETLDGCLLRTTLQKAMSSLDDDSRVEQERLLSERVRAAAESLGVADRRAPLVEEFLTDSSATEPLLVHAAGRSEPGEEKHHFEVLSRAVLLLRLATGACRRMLLGAGITAGETAWWWGELGVCRGLWRIAPEPEDLVDQWQEIADAIEHLQAEVEGEDERMTMLAGLATPLAQLAGAEIVPIWSLPVAAGLGASLGRVP